MIDHSTTTEEAASSSGGNSGKGGDLLFRWGNPLNYKTDGPQEQSFFGQHDAHWIEEGPDKGKIIVYNNGSGRGYSSVDIINPVIDENGHYATNAEGQFLPDDLFWTYDKFNGGIDFFSGRVSSADRLPNGNTLITVGQSGNIFEVDEQKEIVWNYQNPVSSQPLPQGGSANGTALFRSYKYGEDYPAFIDKEIIPGEPIELDPIATSCGIVAVDEGPFGNIDFNIYPNPVEDFLFIDFSGMDTYNDLKLEVVTLTGIKATNQDLQAYNNIVDLSFLEKGIYFLNIKSETKQLFTAKKIIKI